MPAVVEPAEPVTYADAVVIGAGPGGATVGAYLADAGRDVVVVEKDTFPREKVCGDGLTPRAVREVAALGLTAEAAGEAPGWQRSEGLRIYGGGVVLELPWPQMNDWPAHSLSCARTLFDATIADVAVRRGALLWQATEVTTTTPHPRAHVGGTPRVAGVRWRGRDGREGEIRAPVVIAADGASSRVATALGLRRRDDRPYGVAARTYYRSPASADRWLSSFLDLQEDGELLPGYGWLFPMSDGTVNLGAGLLNSSGRFRGTNYRHLMQRWAAAMPAEWELTEETRSGAVRSAALPMGFARTPHHHAGMLLVGDAGGMVNPFNGEGISYAMEAGRLAAEVTDRAIAARSTATLDLYAAELRRRWGGYYTLGRWFVDVIGKPDVMRICVTHGLRREALMRFVLRVMAHLTDERPSDLSDAVFRTLQRLAPAA